MKEVTNKKKKLREKNILRAPKRSDLSIKAAVHILYVEGGHIPTSKVPREFCKAKFKWESFLKERNYIFFMIFRDHFKETESRTHLDFYTKTEANFKILMKIQQRLNKKLVVILQL